MAFENSAEQPQIPADDKTRATKNPPFDKAALDRLSDSVIGKSPVQEPKFDLTPEQQKKFEEMRAEKIAARDRPATMEELQSQLAVHRTAMEMAREKAKTFSEMAGVNAEGTPSGKNEDPVDLSKVREMGLVSEEKLSQLTSEEKEDALASAKRWEEQAEKSGEDVQMTEEALQKLQAEKPPEMKS